MFGNPIRQKKGVGVRTKAGKNVEIEEETNVFVATAEGQLSITTKFIHVFPLYELSGDLSLETGNIDFVGSVTIRGNVGTGYSVKAKGDLFISGLVEGGAFLQAGGEILLSMKESQVWTKPTLKLKEILKPITLIRRR
ncbi:FapA family protein [Gracilibacillus sp. JCM 18860]|uniref:FapA family protein n=1 Tax=Gracilibacillus sp. JCM 18860 TaxID=1306159 RepID=UPI0006D165F3